MMELIKYSDVLEIICPTPEFPTSTDVAVVTTDWRSEKGIPSDCAGDFSNQKLSVNKTIAGESSSVAYLHTSWRGWGGVDMVLGFSIDFSDYNYRGFINR